MAAPVGWEKNTETYAFLVALDISGFSRDLNPDQLLAHRHRFFEAVAETRLFAAAQAQQTVKVHFLGDELRLAFQAVHGVRHLRDFIDAVFSSLERLNNGVPEGYHTRIKGMVLTGSITWKEWHGCGYLDGELPFKSQRWLKELRPNQVAIDTAFRDALQVAGIPVAPLPQHNFGDETGYLLRM